MSYRIGEAPAYRIGRNEAAAGLQLKPAGNAVIRYYIAGFGLSAAIAAGVAAAPTTGPLTRPFRGERFVVPTTVAGAFLLTALASGSDSVFVSVPGAPCMNFSELATEVGLDFPTTLVGTAITAGVTNSSLAAAPFTGMVVGYAAVIN